MAFIRPGCTFIFATVSSPEPVTLRLSRSAAKLISRPKSEGFIGEASTFIKTSFSAGLGFSTEAIEISIFPSLVTFDLISFEFSCDKIYSFYLINTDYNR